MSITTNTWTHPTAGQIRHYINFEDWAPAAGITEESGTYIFPKAQFVPSKKVSRANLQKLKGFKVWADENGKITVDNFYNFYNWGVEDSAEFAQKLESYFNKNSGFDFQEEEVTEEAAEEVTEEATEEISEEPAEFTGTITASEVEAIEAEAAKGTPGKRFEEPVDFAVEAVEEIVDKYGVSNHEIYNAYLKAKGKRTWEMPTPAWKNFKRQFES